MHGLYVLWWVQQKHVSVAAVAAIVAAGDLFITVLELPTGTIDATRTIVGDSVSLEGD